nr:hypothetical protein [Tanacetum cinerariifolium]
MAWADDYDAKRYDASHSTKAGSLSNRRSDLSPRLLETQLRKVLALLIFPNSNPYDLLSQEFDPENYTRSGGELNSVQDDMESEEEVEVVFNESVNFAQ